jgi:hypothetical protein
MFSCLIILSGCDQKRSYSIVDIDAINEVLDSLLGLDLKIQAEQLENKFTQKSKLDSFMIEIVNNSGV